jgi:hypothetical protein
VPNCIIRKDNFIGFEVGWVGVHFFEFKSGGRHEKMAIETWNLRTTDASVPSDPVPCSLPLIKRYVMKAYGGVDV